MAYVIASPGAGWQPIATTETTQRHKLGTIVRADDPTYGGGEFIYLKGIGSTIVGSGVVYNDSFTTALASITLNVPTPVAIAMSANVANQYGWYQIAGRAVVAKGTSVAFNKGVAIGITSGLAVAAASGLVLDGAAVAASVVSAATTVTVMINRPSGPSSD